MALWCNEPLLIREGVARNVGVGISFLENLRADLKRGRFVVLKGSDCHFTTLSYIVYRSNRYWEKAAGWVGIIRTEGGAAKHSFFSMSLRREVRL